jgi:hypothetical protein
VNYKIRINKKGVSHSFTIHLSWCISGCLFILSSISMNILSMYGNNFLVILIIFSQLSIFWQLQIKGAHPICTKLGKNQTYYNVRHDIEINHHFHDKLTQVFHNNKMSHKLFLKESQSWNFYKPPYLLLGLRDINCWYQGQCFFGDDAQQVAIIKETFWPHIAFKKYET